jgi:hypothetical protein
LLISSQHSAEILSALHRIVMPANFVSAIFVMETLQTVDQTAGVGIWFSASSDQGSHWSPAVAVNLAPAHTAVLPWVAAYNGTVDVVYYATTAASKDDPTAVWNVYLAQTTDDGAHFKQSKASAAPNHVGVICTNGGGCAPGTRNLLDLFEVSIDPRNGRAAVIYTDDTLTQDSSCNPLPQVVLVQQN